MTVCVDYTGFTQVFIVFNFSFKAQVYFFFFEKYHYQRKWKSSSVKHFGSTQELGRIRTVKGNQDWAQPSLVGQNLQCGVKVCPRVHFFSAPIFIDYQCSAVTKTTYSKKIKQGCDKIIEGLFHWARVRLQSVFNASVKVQLLQHKVSKSIGTRP